MLYKERFDFVNTLFRQLVTLLIGCCQFLDIPFKGIYGVLWAKQYRTLRTMLDQLLTQADCFVVPFGTL